MLERSTTRYTLTLLLAVNLLNYIDRQTLYAVFPIIKADLHLSDTSLGILGSAFMVCYMLAAPFFGWLGDRRNRPRLAAGGLIVWSLATALSGMAGSYRWLLAARSLVGIGEASFGTVSPGLIADSISLEKRGRMLSIFFLAIPVGSALGYILGGYLGHRFGWQHAFMVVGLPGLLLAVPLAMIKEPRQTDKQRSIPEQRKLASELRSFLNNHTYCYTTLSMTAMTFALGGLAQWVPSFLNRTFNLDVARGNILFGSITVVAGIVGTVAGGWLGDRWQQRNRAGYLHISAIGFFLGAPCATVAILSGSLPLCLAAIFAAELFLFLNTGPLNTVLVNVVSPERRAVGFAVNIFVIHALGDAISPAIIGALSDSWGLGNALLITPAAVLLAALFAMSGKSFVSHDQELAENRQRS